MVTWGTNVEKAVSNETVIVVGSRKSSRRKVRILGTRRVDTPGSNYLLVALLVAVRNLQRMLKESGGNEKAVRDAIEASAGIQIRGVSYEQMRAEIARFMDRHGLGMGEK